MTRNVAQTGSARPGTRLSFWLATAAATVLLGVVPAFAGDRAQANYIGFSDDGTYFAFEQYGIHDGSGGYYSDVFILDLAKDKWLPGVPFSMATEDGEDPAKSLATTRAAALKAATPLLDEFNIHNPVSIAALNGDGVLGPDGLAAGNKSIRFGQPFYAGIQYDYTLKLEQYDAPLSQTCPESADPFLGFSLTLANTASPDYPSVLHKDAALPASRGCPIDYSIYSIVYPLESEGDPVALISIYTTGFEGPDRRFMAVPLGAL